MLVYGKMGGFSNGYVPMFIIVGMDRKVYYNDNSSTWQDQLRKAIDEMVREGIYVKNPVPDKVLLFSEALQVDLSDVFKDLSETGYEISLVNNTDPSLVQAELDGYMLTLTANPDNYGMATVVIKGTSGEFSAEDEFDITVIDPANIIVEDFESGDFTAMPWEFGGDMGWIIDTDVVYEGIYSARSGQIRDSRKSKLIIEAEYPTNGKISYFSKVSSELNYDFLRFFINGTEKRKISGLVDWTESEFFVPKGTNIFEWSYEKDASTSMYSDCAWLDFITLTGGKVTGIRDHVLPSKAVLYQNYPNPFNPSTNIRFQIPEAGEVKLTVFNHKGELVEEIFKGNLKAGNFSYEFNASGLSSGIYFYRLESEGVSLMKKMLMLK